MMLFKHPSIDDGAYWWCSHWIESQHVNKSYHLIGVDLENMFYNWIFIRIQWSNPPLAHYELKSFKSGKKIKKIEVSPNEHEHIIIDLECS